MVFSGIQQCTLLDYPDKVACIIFTPGCHFRCGYCHNPEFVLPEKIAELRNTFIPETAIFNFLNSRRGLLDGVVISGGEPTLMPDLIPFMRAIKALGFLVKLDTNGNRPEVIKNAIAAQAVDYIAMDVKTSLPEYANLVGGLVSPKHIAESISIIINSGVEYEFRSTLVKEIHPVSVLEDMALAVRGARQIYLQTFRPAHTLNPAFEQFHPLSFEELECAMQLFKKEVKEVYCR